MIPRGNCSLPNRGVFSSRNCNFFQKPNYSTSLKRFICQFSHATFRTHGTNDNPVLIEKKLTIPVVAPPSGDQVTSLHDFVMDSEKLVVLTGAGVSTESGIPDYRGVNGAYSKGHKPMTHQEFMRSESNRARYWKRSYIGWQRFADSRPSATHISLARLENRGRVKGGIITQNVDRLHTAARSKNVLELHGTTHDTICCSCGDISARELFQRRIDAMNPYWSQKASAVKNQARVSREDSQRPDGDFDLSESEGTLESSPFLIPGCDKCGGVIKPNVVFFGDNLPKERADKARDMVTTGDSLLVLGSSLTVLSAFRLVKAAHEKNNPIAIVNVGPTRADELCSLKIEAVCGEVLSRLIMTGVMDLPCP